MSKFLLIAFAFMVFMTACDSANPFDDDTTTDDTTDDTTDETIDGDLDLPPGTESPSTGSGITRIEADSYAEGFTYDAASDTLFVDNIGFDGDNTYIRDDQVGSLNGPSGSGQFSVYENIADIVVGTDPVTGADITVSQFNYKALYGVSPSGNSQFAIVRTGSYVSYGFGGYIYQRNAGVVLPTEGQAAYAGDYAGLRDFNDRGGLQYTTGTMTMQIDFDDFNDGNAVAAYITNRAVFDTAGNDVTSDVIADYNETFDTSLTSLPVLRLTVGPGVMDANGEISTTMFSTATDTTGAAVTVEEGTLYAMVSGDNAEEIVGIVVVESEDIRETGGFILDRQGG